MSNIFRLSNATGGLNAACIAATPRVERWRCNFAAPSYEFTSAPIFVLNSALDAWQTACIYTPELPPGFPAQNGTAQKSCTKAAGWASCQKDIEDCTDIEVGAPRPPIQRQPHPHPTLTPPSPRSVT